MRGVPWLAVVPLVVASLTATPMAAAGVQQAADPTNGDPSSAMPVTALPFQNSATYSIDDPAPATDEANSAVARACNGGAPVYLPQWFRYQAPGDVNILVSSAAVYGYESSLTAEVSPVAWVAGDGSTVISCGVTQAFNRQQIGPAFLGAGDAAFAVRFVPTAAKAQSFVRGQYSLHTRLQATPAMWEGDVPNDSWWTPTAIPSDRPSSLSTDVGLASLGSLEVDLAEETGCWRSPVDSYDPIIQPAVWFSYLASENQRVDLNTSGSNYPIAIVVARDLPSGPGDPVCSGGGLDQHSFDAIGGTRYLIGVYGYDRNNVNVAGMLHLAVSTPSAAPASTQGASPDPSTSASAEVASTPVTAPNDAGGAPAPPQSRATKPSGPPARAVSTKVRATRGKSRLYVNVNPNKGRGHWRFEVQRQRSDGSWRARKAYRTRGSQETRTINLKRGTYRVVVRAKYGYLGATSSAVHLKR